MAYVWGLKNIDFEMEKLMHISDKVKYPWSMLKQTEFHLNSITFRIKQFRECSCPKGISYNSIRKTNRPRHLELWDLMMIYNTLRIHLWWLSFHCTCLHSEFWWRGSSLPLMENVVKNMVYVWGTYKYWFWDGETHAHFRRGGIRSWSLWIKRP